jgi:hypothetical protein
MRNQKRNILAVGIMFFGLIACNSEKPSGQSTTIESPAPSASQSQIVVPPLTTTPEQVVSQPAATIPPPPSFNTSGKFSNTNGPINTANAPRLNPPHGQPGHDCAIAVGAPLKSTKASAPAPTQVQVAAPVSSPIESRPVAVPTAAPSNNLNANVKINPAHGQPGHDCAVAVGAPLPVKQ